MVDNSIPMTNNRGWARQSSHDANTTTLTSEKGGNSKPKVEATSPVAKSSAIAAGAEAKPALMWECHTCAHAKCIVKKRCSKCQAWRGGKREGYPTTVYRSVSNTGDGGRGAARLKKGPVAQTAMSVSKQRKQDTDDDDTDEQGGVIARAAGDGGGALSWITINGKKMTVVTLSTPPLRKMIRNVC